MQGSNSTTHISTDGNIVTFDRHGVRIADLCGPLPVLHRIVKINQMPATDKRKLPSPLRLVNTNFLFIREDTKDFVEVSIQHIIAFSKYIEKNDVEEFVENLLLQIPK